MNFAVCGLGLANTDCMFFRTGCHHKPMAMTGNVVGDFVLVVSLLSPEFLNRLLMKFTVYGGLSTPFLLPDVEACTVVVLPVFSEDDCLVFFCGFFCCNNWAWFFPLNLCSIWGNDPEMLAWGRMRSRNRKIRFPMFRPIEMSLLCTSLCTFKATVKTAFVRLQSKPQNIISWLRLDQTRNCLIQSAVAHHRQCHFKFHNLSWDAKVVGCQSENSRSLKVTMPSNLCCKTKPRMMSVCWTHSPISSLYVCFFCLLITYKTLPYTNQK